MGIGNYQSQNAKCVYIELEDVYGKYLDDEQGYELVEDEWSYQDLHYQLIDRVRQVLPDDFEWDEYLGYSDWDKNPVIAENDRFQVTLFQWCNYFVVTIELREQDDRFSEEKHSLVASAIFGRLSGIYSLRVWESPWTSAVYRPRCVTFAA